MSDYRAATGADVALGSLTVLDPQPRSAGIQYTRVTNAASGVVYKEAPFVVLEWSALEDKAEYQTILGVFGLSSAQSAAVTVYVRDENWDYVRMNGRAVKPSIGETGEWSNYFPRDIRIIVKNLTVAS